jgi:hypothetical protein
MCGKASPFRQFIKILLRLRLRFEAEPRTIIEKTSPDRQSLSAHEAAKPLLEASMRHSLFNSAVRH